VVFGGGAVVVVGPFSFGINNRPIFFDE